jgi:hypothetical protein
MYIVPILNVVLTAVMFIASKTVPRDITKMQNWMRDSARPRSEQPAVPAAQVEG